MTLSAFDLLTPTVFPLTIKKDAINGLEPSGVFLLTV